MTDPVLPDLWLDWCAVTGNPVDRRDEATLDRFSEQVAPSRKLLNTLRPATPAPAPAWPSVLLGDVTVLSRLVHGGTSRINDPDVDWITRLRLRRLVFAAVLLAPPDQGGLGLSRTLVRGLTPERLQSLRPVIGRTTDEADCPACAVWSWLEVIGTNNDWSQDAVRALGHQRDTVADEEQHRHERDDPSPGWLDWPDYPNLLPAIDQWGYLDRYGSMHPSSLSGLVHAMATLIDSPDVQRRRIEPEPVGGKRHITAEEEAAILTRADEVNARVIRILEEYG
ncbi:hypothetical protein BS329_18035 [Amycolatopsis coloradensis]|uniref:Uncharacterized protein n=1 Tax=Amycolatopsis coloradensis TaxID=76021 RepID=A0A1R0KT34_9PSEU|nr:hypothetical protein [Amycolatopsis coloradensis]OLZ51141.1 hypothetical protein BS329_18035 [Amycolatopsis coloradensis]